MPRYTDKRDQRLTIHERQYVIPSRTTITLNFAALHVHPKYWGQDAHEFRPDRWLSRNSAGSPVVDFLEPRPGSFVAWNTGPRVCPGKKFSQVEFTRIIFDLFADGNRVHLVQNKDETLTDARSRVLKIVNGAKCEVTLSLRESDDIRLRWSSNP